ncbi:MAG: vitamin K epoxide reductase family protein, partial [Geminicoccales bacterium]
RGTERLLRALQEFEVEQFVFSSTMLVHAAARPGERIDEERPLDPKFPYRASKVEAERLIEAQRGPIPVVYLRAAGVYDDRCSNPFLARQIARISERSRKSHAYPGDLRTGQSFLHLDDLTDATLRLVERRADLAPELPILLGEPEVMSYGELQQDIGRLVHGEEWQTWEVPKALAKTGAWLEDEVLGEEPFIRPWMVDIADDHYALDISRARTLLGWEPKRSLRETLPKMVEALKADPPGWYRANKLNAARVATARVQAEAPPDQQEMRMHMDEMRQMHLGTLWAHFLNIALGLWLITSPFAFGLFDPETAQHVVRDITAERGLPSPVLRNTLVGISDIVSGVLIVGFGALSLSQRLAWAQWANTCVGIWLLFAPLIFWAPTAAAYANDTIVGALVIAFAILVPMMPGMSHEGMLDEADVPPGWTYSPSTYLQRLPIIALGLVGFLIARQLSAYQMGHVDGVWEPFFGGGGDLNGTETIITSDVSKAWPIPDGGLGAVSYMFEVLMGVMGDRRRWRTMPWMVVLFGIVVVPLGVVSIYFIIIQPIVIGTYCTLCLLAALAMLIM